MDRYIGVDVHARSCTLAVVGPSGKRLKSMVVETSGQALVEAIRSIPGRRHLCLEEGTQSAWLHELFQPHVEEMVVAVPAESKGRPKDDARDAWARAEELRIGAIQTRVYKAPAHLTSLRNAARAYGMALQDTVRVKNRLKAVLRSRGILADSTVYEAAKRGTWIRKLPVSHRPFAEWLGRELDQLMPLREEAEEWLLKESKAHPIIRTLATAPGLGPVRTAQLVGIVATPDRFRTRRQFWSYSGLAVVTRSSADWVPDQRGRWVRSEVRQTRGLSRRRQPLLKAIFKGAATCALDVVAARERFEGEHPLVSWSPGRDGETPDAGYAPSEYPLKPWPREAQSGAWHPLSLGGSNPGFEFERVVEVAFGYLADRPFGLVARAEAWPSKRPRGIHQSPVASVGGRTGEVFS